MASLRWTVIAYDAHGNRQAMRTRGCWSCQATHSAVFVHSLRPSPPALPGQTDAAGWPVPLPEREDTAAMTTSQSISVDSYGPAALAASASDDKGSKAKHSERGGFRDRRGSYVQRDRTDIREIRRAGRLDE